MTVPSFEKEYDDRKFRSYDARNLASRFIGNRIRDMYDKMNDKGMTPGGDFTSAINAARNVDARLLLGDMPVEVKAMEILDFNR